MDLHVSRQVQLGQKKHCSRRVVCVISKPEALSQGMLQPDVTNTKTKGLSEIVVSSAWGQSGENLSLRVTFTAKTAVIAAGGTSRGLGEHLCDQACRRHWRRQRCLSTSISQEQQKSRADTVICLWHKIRPFQSDHWPSSDTLHPQCQALCNKRLPGESHITLK